MDVELVEVRDFLARYAPFDVLPPDQLNRLPKHLTQRYHRRGTVIVEVGDQNDQLHVIRTGAVEVCDYDGTLLDSRDEGDCFGYSTLAQSGPSRFRIVAAADTLALEMPRSVFEELGAAVPGFRDFFGERVERIRDDLTSARLAAAGGDNLGTPVRELLTRDAVTVPPSTPIGEGARMMTEKHVSALLVVDHDAVVGILTDRDIRAKLVAYSGDSEAAVSTIMTADPLTVDADSRAFDATLLLIDHGIHHLPVCDGNFPLGMVTSRDLLRLAQTDPVYLAARISRATDAEDVAERTRRVLPMVAELVRKGTAPQDIGRVVTATADGATRRLLTLAEEELGPPPVPYCWVGLGSQARREMGVASDQDNALILGDAAADHPDVDRYFAALADRVCTGLDRAGFPLCPGDVMATNPFWRRTCTQWERQVADWVGAPEAGAMLDAQVFFDLRAIHGDESLVRRVQRQMLYRASESPRFLAHLARIACEWHPPLGFFQGLVVQRRGEYRNTLDLKAGGTAPLVQIARLYSLSAALPATSTRDRLLAAADAGVITAADADEMAAALRIVKDLTYRHHARRVEADLPPDNHTDPTQLSSHDRHRLRTAFRIIARTQSSLSLRYRVRQM